MFLAASVAVSGAAFAAQQGAGVVQAEEAYKALMSGDPELAITNYTLAIDSRTLSDAELATALLNRGLAHQQARQPEQAVADYAQALKLSSLTGPQRSTALYNKGLALQALGNVSAAVDDFTSALYLQPEFAQAYLARGNALRQNGQNLFALSDYDKALRHNHPDKARVHYAQAQAFAALKRPADERKALELALAANPGFAPAAEKLARAGTTPATKPASDPLLTASSAPVGGSVTIKKPELPKAMTPPADLADKAADQVAVAESSDAPSQQTVLTETVNQPEKPRVIAAAVSKPKKKYLDRILPEAEQVAFVAKPRKPAPVQEVAEVETNDAGAAATTASIEPAAAPAGMNEETDSETTTTASSLSGWTVQVASAASENAAWSTFKKMQDRKPVLRNGKPVVVRADLGDKGVFYRVRFGFDSQKEAQKACAKFKSGGVSCFVSKSSS